MGDGNDGDLRLLAQREAKPEGAMRGEVADQDVRQRLVASGSSSSRSKLSSPASPFETVAPSSLTV